MRRSSLFFLAFAATLAVSVFADGLNNHGADWPSVGYSSEGRRFVDQQHNSINSQNVHRLRQKWNITLAGDVTTSPAVVDDRMYFTDAAGFIHCHDSISGVPIWSRSMGNEFGVAATGTRSPITYYKGSLVLGISSAPFIIRVNATDGSLIWKVQISDYPRAQVTQAVAIVNNEIYVGTSSSDETYVLYMDDPSKCCGFSSSFMKLRFADGSKIWETPMIPQELAGVGKYSGAAIWGGQPTLDEHYVYIGTGNLYNAPESANQCQETANAAGTPDATCTDASVLWESIVKMDRRTGKVVAHNRVSAWDSWTFHCGYAAIGLPRTKYCPPTPNNDNDFGQSVALVGDLAVIGNKNGILYGFHRSNMSMAFATPVGTSGTFGGLIYGLAVGSYKHTAHKTIAVVGDANSDRLKITLMHGQNITYGSWSALDAQTGELLWQIPNPNGSKSASAPMIVNDVALVASSSQPGGFYALHVRTGEVLWSTITGSNVYSGAVVVNDKVYLGLGYSRLAPGPGGKALICYGLDDLVDEHHGH